MSSQVNVMMSSGSPGRGDLPSSTQDGSSYELTFPNSLSAAVLGYSRVFESAGSSAKRSECKSHTAKE